MSANLRFFHFWGAYSASFRSFTRKVTNILVSGCFPGFGRISGLPACKYVERNEVGADSDKLFYGTLFCISYILL